jgi:hypothetical protein
MRTLDLVQTMPVDINGARDAVVVEPKIDYEGRPIKILEKDILVTVSIAKKGEPR